MHVVERRAVHLPNLGVATKAFLALRGRGANLEGPMLWDDSVRGSGLRDAILVRAGSGWALSVGAVSLAVLGGRFGLSAFPVFCLSLWATSRVPRMIFSTCLGVWCACLAAVRPVHCALGCI